MNRCSSPTLRIVVLAAGFSRRLGVPKALARVRGRSLLARTLSALRPFQGGHPILVIVPPRALRYRLEDRARQARFVSNPRRADGLSASVGRGLVEARFSSAVLLLPVDLAQLTRRDLMRLIARWRGARRRVTASLVGALAGTPLILPKTWYGATRSLGGDQGLRAFIRALPAEHSTHVILPSAQADIDTPEDLARARRRPRAL